MSLILSPAFLIKQKLLYTGNHNKGRCYSWLESAGISLISSWRWYLSIDCWYNATPVWGLSQSDSDITTNSALVVRINVLTSVEFPHQPRAQIFKHPLCRESDSLLSQWDDELTSLWQSCEDRGCEVSKMCVNADFEGIVPVWLMTLWQLKELLCRLTTVARWILEWQAAIVWVSFRRWRDPRLPERGTRRWWRTRPGSRWRGPPTPWRSSAASV